MTQEWHDKPPEVGQIWEFDSVSDATYKVTGFEAGTLHILMSYDGQAEETYGAPRFSKSWTLLEDIPREEEIINEPPDVKEVIEI